MSKKFSNNRLKYNGVNTLSRNRKKFQNWTAKRSQKNFKTSFPVINDWNNLTWLDDIIQSQSTSQNKLEAILKRIEADESFYTLVPEVCQEISEAISFAPGFKKTIPVGSAVTRVALKGSNIDFFLEFEEHSDINSDAFLNEFKDHLKESQKFSQIAITQGKIRTIKCLHHSKTYCSLYFTNKIDVAFSSFTKILLDSDKRLRPFMLLLKLFLKKEEFLKIKGVGLTTLVIYFFQQLEKPLLPSMMELLKTEGPEQIIEGWDASFPPTLDQLPKTENTMSVVELLLEFFQYFSTFDFNFCVMSPFTGKHYPKPIFVGTKNLPAEFSRFKENFAKRECKEFLVHKPMCVQHILKHCENVTSEFKKYKLLVFQKTCREITDMFENDQGEKGAYALMRILKYVLKDIPKGLENIIVAFPLPYDLIKAKCLTLDELKAFWTHVTLENFYYIFNKVLQCEVKSYFPEEYRAKGNHGINRFDTIKVFECDMLYPKIVTKIRGRSRRNLGFANCMTALEKEEMVTKYLLDTHSRSWEKDSFKFLVAFYLRKKPTRMEVELFPVGNNREYNLQFKRIIRFLKNACFQWIAE